MMEESPSVVYIVISFIVSFLVFCDGPEPQAVSTVPNTHHYLELNLSAESLAIEDARVMQTVLEKRLTDFGLDVSLLEDEGGAVSFQVSGVVAEDELSVINLLSQRGLVELRFVKEASSELADLTLVDLEASLFTDAIFERASVAKDDFGATIVQFRVKEDYQEALAQVTAENIGKRLAIVVDGTIVTAPIVNEQVSSDIILTGMFDEAEAKHLALIINSEPLAVDLTIESIRTQ